MVKESQLCNQCAQVITNPVCARCFSRHVVYWLVDKNVSNKNRDEIIKKIYNYVLETEKTHSETSCIFCGFDRVNLCTYCFNFKVLGILNKSLKDESLVKRFQEDFDTSLWTIQI